MTLAKQLKKYLEMLGITQKELSAISGLSRATISRYCSGQREPSAGSKEICDLAAGLSSLPGALSFDDYLKALTGSLSEGAGLDYDAFVSKLRFLMQNLDLRPSELARGIYMDPSHISRILSGNRRPRNINVFIGDTAAFITQRYTGSTSISSLADILDLDASEVNSSSALRKSLVAWLGSPEPVQDDEYIPDILTLMDEFDIYNHLLSEKNGKMPMPTATPRKQARKEYDGIEAMKEAELDFLRATVLSESTEPCILYNDMPIGNMMTDQAFRQKYLNGVSAILKIGLHIDFIHNMNRPLPELMTGLENYLPMYMTGQISPYYLPTEQSGTFMHLLKVSGAAALEGSAVAGNHESGRYVLHQSKADLSHYRKLAEDLFAHAKPLLESFSSDRESDFASFLSKQWESGNRKTVCSSLPVYLADEDLIEEIVQNAELMQDTKDKIMRYHSESRRSLMRLLEKNRAHYDLPKLDEEAFTKAPLSLALSDIFVEESVPLTFDMYQRYLDGVEELAAEHDTLLIGYDTAPVLRNINYTLIRGRLVIISKEKSPAIHFAIYHKRLVRAFVNFIPKRTKKS